MPNANARGDQANPPAVPPSRGRRIAAAKTLGVAAGALALAWALASASVPCGFARMFHVPCPGCGSTRAMLCLFHGDLAGLVRMNPLAPFMSLLVLAFVVQVLASLGATGTLSRLGHGLGPKITTRGLVAVAILQVVLWLLRFGGLFGGPVPV